MTPVRNLEGFRRYGGTIVARCDCGRIALFHASSLAYLYQAKRWDDGWPEFAARLHCRPSLGGCGRRWPSVVYSQRRLSVKAFCTVVRVPAGVDPVQWAGSDDRERKLLIRHARG